MKALEEARRYIQRLREALGSKQRDMQRTMQEQEAHLRSITDPMQLSVLLNTIYETRQALLRSNAASLQRLSAKQRWLDELTAKGNEMEVEMMDRV
ncbi:hypothetical protein BZG36_02879 [Bifiguratus adelaidae]|uniref:Uncharacterized protein n=1 Tax=Bifiguratus adelaidae TaxID=1938954 RepID=A0A261Y242_9FUNG|nr:hypothetical protein BZG36_02879 [Bifiguratus adelaidae]